MTTDPYEIAVAGGGAAGFFAALRAKQLAPGSRVVILEKSREILAKVSISGGGRCNVTHDCYDPAELCRRYPRGGKELRGPFHRFQPADTIEWFESRGVKLKAEADGRIFPVSDDSADIVDTLTREANALGVEVRRVCGLAEAGSTPSGFQLRLTDGSRCSCRALIIATGGNRASGGWKVAEDLGHTIVPPVPSLFSFHVRDPVLEGLAGISVDPVEVRIPDMNARNSGPLLITHKGLSGPAILKLSAWQARELAERRDQVGLELNWLGDTDPATLGREFDTLRQTRGARAVHKTTMSGLPRRLWERLCLRAGIGDGVTWARLDATQRDALATTLTAMPCTMRGKTLNKEEFVTCGGVDLKEIDMKTFRSRIHPHLFFAGEVLNIDGVTGGFNFQAAWTGGWLAGTAAAATDR